MKIPTTTIENTNGSQKVRCLKDLYLTAHFARQRKTSMQRIRTANSIKANTTGGICSKKPNPCNHIQKVCIFSAIHSIPVPPFYSQKSARFLTNIKLHLYARIQAYHNFSNAFNTVSKGNRCLRLECRLN